MIECLMLDVDGVVVHDRPSGGRTWAADIEQDLGIRLEALRARFFVPHWDDVVTGRRPLMEALAACLPELAPDVTPQRFVDYWLSRESHVDAAVLADCAALRRDGVRVLLATNQENLRAEHLMTRLALADHVDGMVHSAAVGARKPDRAFFDAAALRAGTAPSALLLVDDTPENVEGARKAGWRAAHWTPGARLIDLVRG
ncbi:putative hydrolase of the HAD superfamily [Amorphus suaedae]